MARSRGRRQRRAADPVIPRAIMALLCVLAAGGAPRLQTGAIEGTLHAADVRTAGAVVYLVPAEGAVPAEVADTALVDQHDLRFDPPVLAVRPGTTVEFQNSDAILHNVFSPSGQDYGFDLGTYPRGDRRSHTFTQPGAYVILCHVHPEMVAYVVVVPTPYHAVADDDGRFRLEGVPPGRYALAVWHYRAAPLKRAVEIAPGTVLHLELELARARHTGRH